MKSKPGFRPSPSTAQTGPKEELAVLRQKTAELAVQRPEKAATVLAEWIRQPASLKQASQPLSRKKAG
jgi:flagellar biosynthesis/type III secretory pathway M-ring protein FliF/YscJ